MAYHALYSVIQAISNNTGATEMAFSRLLVHGTCRLRQRTIASLTHLKLSATVFYRPCEHPALHASFVHAYWYNAHASKPKCKFSSKKRLQHYVRWPPFQNTCEIDGPARLFRCTPPPWNITEIHPVDPQLHDSAMFLIIACWFYCAVY